MTITRAYENCIGSAQPSGGGGQTVNNEDVTITENGEYSASEGYTGIGKATVNVPTFDIIASVNKTGSTINTGDKVWVNKVGADYELVNFYQGDWVLQASKGSSISYNSNTGIGSSYGSSSNGGIVLRDTMPISTANSWKIVFKAKTPASITRNQTLINAPNQFWNASVTAEIDSTNPAGYYMSCAIRTASGNVWNIWLVPNISKEGVLLSTDTWYWWSIEFTGTEYITKQSTDGVNYIELAKVSSTTKAYTASQAITTGYVIDKFWQGLVDYSQSYIEVNGSLWWKGALRDTKAENYLTGYAQESIANNASGSVKTILPSV